MNGYNFTERVRRVLAIAREEAGRLRHEYVGTEHILLGLTHEGPDGMAGAVLFNFGIDPDAIRARVEELVTEGRASHVTGPDLPYTSRAKKTLELAMTEARELRHSYVGTEHVLLGLLREGKGVAAQVLGEFGVTLEKVRSETLRLLGSEMREDERRVAAAAAAAGASRPHRPPGVPLRPPGRPAWPAMMSALNAAELRRAEAEAIRLELETQWLHVRHMIELGMSTGTPVRLARAADHSLWVVLGEDLMRVRVPGSGTGAGPGSAPEPSSGSTGQ